MPGSSSTDRLSGFEVDRSPAACHLGADAGLPSLGVLPVHPGPAFIEVVWAEQVHALGPAGLECHVATAIAPEPKVLLAARLPDDASTEGHLGLGSGYRDDDNLAPPVLVAALVAVVVVVVRLAIRAIGVGVRPGGFGSYRLGGAVGGGAVGGSAVGEVGVGADTPARVVGVKVV